MTEDTPAAERWLPVPGYEGLYEVSDQGRVRSQYEWRGRGKPGHLLGGTVSVYGYRTVNLAKDKVYRTAPVHMLVAEAFLGPPPADGPEVRHLDGNRLHNDLSNLCYGSRSLNTLDSVRHGTHNNARKTHCPQGHPYNAENTAVTVNAKGSRGRACRTCRTARNRANKARKRAA